MVGYEVDKIKLTYIACTFSACDVIDENVRWESMMIIATK